MNSFQIVDSNTVTITARGSEYTVIRRTEGFRVYCVNASSKAYRRGYPAGREFKTLAEAEAGYKGLAGVAAIFPAVAS